MICLERRKVVTRIKLGEQWHATTGGEAGFQQGQTSLTPQLDRQSAQFHSSHSRAAQAVVGGIVAWKRTDSYGDSARVAV